MRCLALLALGACGGTAAPRAIEHPGPRTCDVSDRDKAAAFYEQITGVTVTEQDCVALSETFAGWVMVGPRWDDSGCAYDAQIYGCALITSSSAAEALADAGYAAADPPRRVALIIAYLEEIVGEQVLPYDEHGDITASGQTFIAPTLEDGVLTYWAVWYGQFPVVTVYKKITRAVSDDGVPDEPGVRVVLEVHST